MNILFCMSYTRAVVNILPAILELCERHTVYVFSYRKMGSWAQFGGAAGDIRPGIHKALADAGAIDLGEPPEPHSVTQDTYSAAFKKAVAPHSFDLAIFDENVGKLRWGSPALYGILRRKGVPVVGCQEGSVEDFDEVGLGPISRNLGICYDYCFCIGEYDKRRMLARNTHLEGRIFAVGMPSNDGLSAWLSARREPGHILLVPSWTRISGPEKRFRWMTDEVIEQTGIYELAEESGLPILIKEKSKGKDEYAFKHLESDMVRVSMEDANLDALVAQSRFVIGAPSTLLFKSLQLRIPTAVLSEPYMAQAGVFEEFEGFIKLDRKAVRETLLKQDEQGGAGDEFIETAVAGGSDFSCTRRFVTAVEAIAETPSTYTGPVLAGRSQLPLFMAKHPALAAVVNAKRALLKKLRG